MPKPDRPFTVTAHLIDGRTYTIKTCCERDAVSRLSIFGKSSSLDQPDDMPRTCADHAYR